MVGLPPTGYSYYPARFIGGCFTRTVFAISRMGKTSFVYPLTAGLSAWAMAQEKKQDNIPRCLMGKLLSVDGDSVDACWKFHSPLAADRIHQLILGGSFKLSIDFGAFSLYYITSFETEACSRLANQAQLKLSHR